MPDANKAASWAERMAKVPGNPNVVAGQMQEEEEHLQAGEDDKTPEQSVAGAGGGAAGAAAGDAAGSGGTSSAGTDGATSQPDADASGADSTTSSAPIPAAPTASARKFLLPAVRRVLKHMPRRPRQL